MIVLFFFINIFSAICIRGLKKQNQKEIAELSKVFQNMEVKEQANIEF